MKPTRIAAIGEIMVELSVGDGKGHDTQVNFAGDTANTAVYLKRQSLESTDVAYVTVVGCDVLSDRIVEFLDSESLDTRLVNRHPTRPPGLYAISVDSDGERSFVYWRDNSAARTLFQSFSDIDNAGAIDENALQRLNQFEYLYFSGITLGILSEQCRERFLDWLPHYRASGGRVVFDSNFRPALWQSKSDAQRATSRAWAQCDIALPSVDDEQALYGDSSDAEVMSRLRAHGIREGVLKRGAVGPLPIDSALVLEAQPVAEKVVDTTAAGDSFNGAYLAARLSGASEAEAIRRGHRCAIAVIGSRGAIVSMKTSD